MPLLRRSRFSFATASVARVNNWVKARENSHAAQAKLATRNNLSWISFRLSVVGKKGRQRQNPPSGYLVDQPPFR